MDKRMAKSVIRLLITLLLISSVVFAWLNYMDYRGNSIAYNKNLFLSNATMRFKTYYYVAENDNFSEDDYKELPQQDSEKEFVFEIEGLYPGERVYFKTEIENVTDAEAIYSMYLSSIKASDPLCDYVSLYTSTPSFYDYEMRDIKKKENETININGEDKDMYSMSSLPLANNLKIGGKSKVNLYWSISVSNAAENDCSFGVIRISSIQLN